MSTLAGVVLMVGIASGATGAVDPVPRVRHAPSPIAVRGGVVLVPLAPPAEGPWPREVELTTAEGETLRGPVAWIEPAAVLRPGGVRRWTDPPTPRRIRPINEADGRGADAGRRATGINSRASLGGAYALVRLPAEGDGPLQLGVQTIHPIWVDRPAQAIPDDAADAASTAPAGVALVEPILTRRRGAAWPDLSPFEHWRWVLLAEALGRRPPPAPPPALPPGDPGAGDGTAADVRSLLAEHLTDLWRVGLSRVAEESPGVAKACRDLLVAQCEDRQSVGGPVAAWVADAEELATLLGILLDLDRPRREAVMQALAWADAQPRLLVWPLADLGDRVQLAVMNRGFGTAVARLVWFGAGDDIPVAVELPGRRVTRVTIDRPTASGGHAEGGPLLSGPPASVYRLRIEADGWRRELPVAPAPPAARPPALFLRPPVPPLTLADVQHDRVLTTPPALTTHVQVRKLYGRWEIFADCRRPVVVEPVSDDPSRDMDDEPGAADAAPADDGAAAGSADPAATGPGNGASPSEPVEPRPATAGASWLDDLRGREALTLLLGRAPASGGPAPVTLVLPEHGPFELLRNEPGGEPRVLRRSFADRWHVRIILPDQWVRRADLEPLLVGYVRTHGGSLSLQCGPSPAAPWQAAMPRQAVDLSRWDPPMRPAVDR